MTLPAPTRKARVLDSVPSVDGGATVLDIVGLLDTITKRGGVRRVQEQSLWKEVGPSAWIPRSPVLLGPIR